ncbi:MAG: hypothetical protein K0S34_1076 [Bacillales bacterium]|jgi:hypothetical protein|nr:hypothetical protein [Bacillales bacterium]
MYDSLPQGIKNSITRSIKTAFENYMKKIEWNSEKYSWEDFLEEWKDTFNNNSAWFAKVDESTKEDSRFHESLALKVTEVVEKLLSEDPTQEQLDELKTQKLSINVEDISCRLEAKYYLEQK